MRKRTPTIRTTIIGLSIAVVAVAIPQTADAQYMGKGAGVGALLGLALSDGWDVWDVAEDVAAGAALGAAGGGIANMATGGKTKKQRRAEMHAYDEQRRRAEYDAYMAQRQREMDERERRWAEQQISQRERELLEREARLAEQERLKAQAAQSIRDVAVERQDAETTIIQAIGPDVWEGYKALRGCNPERAYALANVGATSSHPYHQLGALWLEAMTAVDTRDSSRSQAAFNKLVKYDPEIDTVQQASLAADQAVLDMRSERRDIGITCR